MTISNLSNSVFSLLLPKSLEEIQSSNLVLDVSPFFHHKRRCGWKPTSRHRTCPWDSQGNISRDLVWVISASNGQHFLGMGIDGRPAIWFVTKFCYRRNASDPSAALLLAEKVEQILTEQGCEVCTNRFLVVLFSSSAPLLFPGLPASRVEVDVRKLILWRWLIEPCFSCWLSCWASISGLLRTVRRLQLRPSQAPQSLQYLFKVCTLPIFNLHWPLNKLLRRTVPSKRRPSLGIWLEVFKHRQSLLELDIFSTSSAIMIMLFAGSRLQ